MLPRFVCWSGKFVNVADKDSEDNERQEILMTTPHGTKIAFTQIAGLVARRIYCPLHEGDTLKAGEVFGMIRFGSRLDVFLPKGRHTTPSRSVSGLPDCSLH